MEVKHGADLKDGDWVSEVLVPGWRQQMQVKKVIFQSKSDSHSLAVFENEHLGRVLVIEDRIQLTSADEFTYHEMFAHVPIVSHGHVKKVMFSSYCRFLSLVGGMVQVFGNA